MSRDPKVGQRVAYSAKFLRSTGSDYDTSRLRGIIKEVRGAFGGSILVKVLWEGETETRGALSVNLSLAEKGAAVQDLD